jgi:hypothetical protein
VEAVLLPILTACGLPCQEVQDPVAEGGIELGGNNSVEY